MASSSSSYPRSLLVFLAFAFLVYLSESQTTFKPNKFVLPVSQDAATNLQVATIYNRNPQIPLHFVVDLNGRFLWMNCEQNYLSSTHQNPQCHSTQCHRANSNFCHTCTSKSPPGCHNNTCGLMAVNPVSLQSYMGELTQDVLTILSTTGSSPGPLASVPGFLLTCAPSVLLQRGLPKNVSGVVGLGHSPIALPYQLASNFGIRPNFAICLSSSKSGAVFFGDGPFYLRPQVDVTRGLSYTPLLVSRPGQYYVEVTSIKINQKVVPINTSLLRINKRGNGGTMISTTAPYTSLEHSIYQTVIEFFVSQLAGVPREPPVAPFNVCYNVKNFYSRGVPNIDLVFSNQNVVWTISASNSMVQPRPGVSCLAFVDAGLHPRSRASIVIGAYQLMDNFLQFDLASSRLGFSNSLLSRKTSCANFNFTNLP